jgi:hypothetical protein
METKRNSFHYGAPHNRHHHWREESAVSIFAMPYLWKVTTRRICFDCTPGKMTSPKNG